MVALLACLSSAASPAGANHNKGIPHYGYFENYPQVPIEEYVAIDGPWEIGAVIFNFQGLDRRKADTPNDVKIYLYLYDNRTQSAYQGPLDVEIRQGDELVSTFQRDSVDEESVYSTRETLPRSGDYQLVAHVRGERASLPFHIELANEGVRWSRVIGIALISIGVLALATFGHGRRLRNVRPSRAHA